MQMDLDSNLNSVDTNNINIDTNNINIDTNNTNIDYNYKSSTHVPPFNTDYTEYDVSNYSDECLRMTIGTSGKNFKKITEQNKIAYIYHNKLKNKIEIWGEKNKFNKVIQQLQNYLTWSYNYLYIRDHTL